MPTRRDLMSGSLSLALALPFAGAGASASASLLDPIEATLYGGRLGLAAMELGTRRRLFHRPDERFAACSTFKVPLAAAVLAGIDAGRMGGEQRIAFTAADLLDYAPVTRAAVSTGSMSVHSLCEAAVVVSDNTAANLLLPLIGGPSALTRFARTQGDLVSRFDRTEPALNTNLAGDPRDTTSPRAMSKFLKQVLVGHALTPESRLRLIGWMVACQTGKARLRAGFPSQWGAGDKTGTGERGAVNDIAIAFRPNRSPLLIASYVDAPHAPLAIAEAAHAAAARRVAALFG